MTLQGHVAIVTGAGGEGMGRSIALTLGREGAAVVVNYRTSRDRAEATARAIEELSGASMTFAADVADASAVDAMFAAARDRFGHVDIVVNSAGAPWKPQDVTEITPEHLRDVLAREVEATYHLLRASLPQMRDRGWGRFISIGGHLADDWRFGPPDAPLDYPLGKAARHWLTRTLAPRELPHGITINAIAPGPTARFTFDQAVAAARDHVAQPPPAGSIDVAQPSPAVQSSDKTEGSASAADARKDRSLDLSEQPANDARPLYHAHESPASGIGDMNDPVAQPSPAMQSSDKTEVSVSAADARKDRSLDLSEKSTYDARTATPAGNTPQTIAEIAAFLCTDAAARISGAIIPVPGHRPV